MAAARSNLQLLIEVVAGFAALGMTHAWFARSVSSGTVALRRVSTTLLLVSPETFQRWQEGLFIMVAVL